MMLAEKRILLVDDNKGVLTILTSFLSSKGFMVFAGEDGIEGLDLFRKETFDIVLTDFQMPKMDGLSLAQTIKKDSPETPVILMTATSFDLPAQRKRWPCFDDILLKPFSMDDLANTIQHLVK